VLRRPEVTAAIVGARDAAQATANAALAGRPLTRTDFRVPRLATTDLSGRTVLAVVSHGKHLLTRVDRGDEAWTLHTHLKMEGTWRVLERDQRWPRPAHQARVVLTTEDAVAVGFSLGIVELIDRADEESLVAHLGPDLLGPDWDADEAARRLTADPGRPLGEALLDQRLVAGIGNKWMAEALWEARLSPWLRVRDVSDEELRTAVATAARLMHEALNGGRRGRRAYRRAGRPCSRCGEPIRSRGQGDANRTAYWCPHCQPGADPDAAGAK
jgi:endonuclease-8